MWNPFAERPPIVAVVRLEGVLAARRPGPFSVGLSAAALAPVLERAFGLRRAAGVMLAINSPGGSPVQSSLIAARVRELAAEKHLPVIAVCEDAAASGGYWIACAADEIVADAASIVGSIGVISGGFGFAEAIARLGVERRLRTAGSEKALLDPFSPEAPADRARLEELLATLHEEFKGWVRERRGGRFKAGEETLFTGRFWTGRQGLELGLVDRLGTLRGEARRRWGEKVRLVPVGPRRRRLPFLSGFAGAALAESLAGALEERALWARLGL